MAGKGAKKRNSKDSTGSKEKKKSGKKKNGRTTGGSSAKSSKIQGDIFGEGAMENAYLICHNVQVIRSIIVHKNVQSLFITNYLIWNIKFIHPLIFITYS